MALTAADIAYWPATPRMKSMRPAIAERLDNSGILNHSLSHSPSLFDAPGTKALAPQNIILLQPPNCSCRIFYSVHLMSDFSILHKIILA